MHRRWAALAGLIVMSVAVLGACAGNATDREASSKSALADGGVGSYALAAALNKGPAIGAQAAKDRQVVYKGSITVRVHDAEKAADQALAIADRAGGYLGNQDAQLEGERQVRVTLRVPADRFDDVMAKAAKLGKVEARSVDSQDVTDQVVDLKGRLENAQASTARLRGLLDKAENVANIATLEDKLTQREAEIEQISGQLEVIGNDVQYATVRLVLTEKAAPTVSKDLPGPLEALRAGAVAVVNVLVVIAAVIAFALPFVPFALLGWWFFRIWRRRHPKPGRPVPPQPFPTTPPQSPAGPGGPVEPGVAPAD